MLALKGNAESIDLRNYGSALIGGKHAQRIQLFAIFRKSDRYNGNTCDRRI